MGQVEGQAATRRWCGKKVGPQVWRPPMSHGGGMVGGGGWWGRRASSLWMEKSARAQKREELAGPPHQEEWVGEQGRCGSGGRTAGAGGAR